MSDKAEAAVRQIIVTVLTAGVIGGCGLMYDAVSGHATTVEVERVESESRARDLELGAQIKEAARRAELERIEQAEFRGKVLERLKIGPDDSK